MGRILPLLSIEYDIGIKLPTKVDMPFKKFLTKHNQSRLLQSYLEASHIFYIDDAAAPSSDPSSFEDNDQGAQTLRPCHKRKKNKNNFLKD